MSDELVSQARRQTLREKLQEPAYRAQYATTALFDNVALQVRALRRQRGLSQDEVAKRAGTKQPKISNIESPKEGDRLPNWELATLDRVAQALGTRVRVSFETYGTLIDESDSLTSESLRRPEPENDPLLFTRPEMPRPDAKAPERTQWMQEVMIPYLWDDRLDRSTLLKWLQDRGLPPVGHDEPTYLWLLRGIPKSVSKAAAGFLRKRLAEMLSIILGEQPDVEPVVADQSDDFLINLYRTCAGLEQPDYLARELWAHYQRLNLTRPSGAVRDALEAALISNQIDDRMLGKIWKPMVETGRHPRTRKLRGGEVAGFEGIVALCRAKKADVGEAIWALGVISHRWEGTVEQYADFERLMKRIPSLGEPKVAEQLLASARGRRDRWSAWALSLLPTLTESYGADGSITIRIGILKTEFVAEWAPGQPAWTAVADLEQGAAAKESWPFTGRPEKRKLLNALLTFLSSRTTDLRPEIAAAYSELKTTILSERVARLEPVTISKSNRVSIGPISEALLCAELGWYARSMHP